MDFLSFCMQMCSEVVHTGGSKSLSTRGNTLNIKCQVTFAPFGVCDLLFVAVTVRWWKQMNFFWCAKNKIGAKLFVATVFIYRNRLR